MGLFPGRVELAWRAFRKNGLSGVKNVFNRFREAGNRREASNFVPFSAQIEVTTKCNLRCAMCEHSHWTEKAEDLSLADFKRIVDNNPFLLTLNLTGIGESFLNPEFFQMVEYAKSRGIFVWFNDNMTLMDDARAKKAIESGVDVIAVSLDGATRETFEGIRQGAKFEDVIRNLKGLVRMKMLMKSKTPKLFISFVVMPSNYREMPGVARIAQGLGIGNVTYVGALEFEQNKEMGFRRIGLEDYEKYEAGALEVRAKHGVDMRLPAKRQAPMPYSSCSLPWESPYINHRGEVLPCCFATQRNDPALYKASVLGNAIEEPFEKIWNNEKYRALRRGLLSNKPVPICRGCAKVKGY